MGVGATVTITGVITNGDELGPIRYIEDATAGMALYDPTVMAGTVRGEEITVSGVLVDYNGLMEMQPVNSVTINSAGNSVTPQVVTPLQVGESTEGELIQIDNVLLIMEDLFLQLAHMILIQMASQVKSILRLEAL